MAVTGVPARDFAERARPSVVVPLKDRSIILVAVAGALVGMTGGTRLDALGELELPPPPQPAISKIPADKKTTARF